MVEYYPHKSCSCRQCKAGKNKTARNEQERKLRRETKKAINNCLERGDLEDMETPIIAGGYFD